VIYLSPTTEGKNHDKKGAEQSGLSYPPNVSLTKDTGFRAYDPAGVLNQQPKKR